MRCDRPVRIGVIGAGAWGLNHIRILAAHPRCELVAIADPKPQAIERARLIAPDAALVHDADHVLGHAAIDAVVIASPAPTHATLAVAAFRARKHVLIEKPMAMTTQEARIVVDAARAAQCVGMVGHLMLYHPAVLRLRELLRSGVLGKLHYLHATRVNLGRLRRDENALWSFGPHDLSMIEFLSGLRPVSVSARGQSVLQPNVEDVVFLNMKYASGEMAHVHLSWLSPRKERRLTIVGSQKMAEFDDVAHDKLRVYDKGYDRPPEFTEYAEYLTVRDGDVLIPQIAMREPLQLQLEHFVDCIETGEVPRSSLESGASVTAVLEAAQLSLRREGAPHEVAYL